ncbi:MAG: type 4a pilus biogenesis protein PilO [Trichloromonas sp.]|jgi:type IV pilus assembly protein PilO|nr:type 4a pilus biogenesis protein PilO [Trichloromonas sp.]
MTGNSLLRAAWRMNKTVPVLLLLLLLIDLGAWAGLRLRLEPRLQALEQTYLQRQEEVRRQQKEGRAPRPEEDGLILAEQDLATFRQAIPPRAELSGLLGELFTLADEAGLRIDQIGYDPQALEGRPFLRYSLRFSVSGSYLQVKRFVHALEESPRLIALESLTLSGTDDPDRGDVTLNIKLSTLFRTEEP